MPNDVIVLPPAQVPADVAPPQQVPAYVDERDVVRKSGSVMDDGRTIQLGRDPVGDFEAATKRYVDNLFKVRQFATLWDFQHATIPLDITRVWLNGYFRDNDGNGCFWTRCAIGDTVTIDMVLDAAGLYWRVARGQPTHSGNFGTKRDSTGGGSGRVDFSTDDTGAWKRYIAWAMAGLTAGEGDTVLNQPDGFSKISDSLITEGATHGLTFRGTGANRCGFAPTPFGASKALFDFVGNTRTSKPQSRPTLEHMSVKRGLADVEHPIVFRFPYAGRVTINHVDVGSIGNEVIVGTSPFNCTISDCNFISTGDQRMKRMLSPTLRVDIEKDSPIIRANEDGFTSDMAGEEIWIAYAGDDNNYSDSICARVQSVTDARTLTLTAPVRRTSITARAISFGRIRATASLANPYTVNFDGVGAVATDVGRRIYVHSAGYRRGLHVTTVASVAPDGRSVTLTDPIQYDVANVPMYYTAVMFWGGVDRSATALDPLNDVNISDVNCETFRGVGVIAHGGLQIYFKGLKCHGLNGSNNNFAQSSHPLTNSRVSRLEVISAEWEFCCPGLGMGMYVQMGAPTKGVSGKLDNVTLNGTQCNGWLASTHDTGDLSYLIIGDVSTAHDFGEDGGREGWIYRGPVRCSSAVERRRVHLTGRIAGLNETADQALLLKRGDTGSLNDDAVYKLNLPSGWGSVAIWTDRQEFRGYYWFRTTTDPDIALMGVQGSATTSAVGVPTGTTGADNSLNVYAAAGALYIENRTGVRKSIEWRLDFAEGGALWSTADLGSDLLMDLNAAVSGTMSIGDEHGGGNEVNSITDPVTSTTFSATGSARPTWDATAFAGEGGIVADGIDDVLEAAVSPLVGATPFEVWTVWREDGLVTTTGVRTIFKIGGSTNALGFSQYRNSSTTRNRLGSGSGDGTNSVTAVDQDDDISGIHVLRSIFEGTRVGSSVDGGPITWSDLGTVTTHTGKARLFANTSNTSPNYAQGAWRRSLACKRQSDETAAKMVAALLEEIGVS